MSDKEIFIISLGGSLIAPAKGIDWKFLKQFRQLLINEMKLGKRFVIVTGGGDTARTYQQAANRVIRLTDDDKDWLGIHATRLNAHLIKTIFRAYAHPRINKNPRTKENLRRHFAAGEGLMVAAGWRPGWSTDLVAVILAERLGASALINLSNIDYIYDQDPRKNRRAKKLTDLSWPEFRRLVGNRWDPGLNAPFDPVASGRAEQLGLRVIIMHGKNLDNLKKYLAGQGFKGSIIS